MKLIFILILIIIVGILFVLFLLKNKEQFVNNNESPNDSNYIFNVEQCERTVVDDIYNNCEYPGYYILKNNSINSFTKIGESNADNIDQCQTYCSDNLSADIIEYIQNNTNQDIKNCGCYKTNEDILPNINDKNLSQESVLMILSNYFEINDNLEVKIYSPTTGYLSYDYVENRLKCGLDNTDNNVFKIIKSKSQGYDSYYKILPKLYNNVENFSSPIYFSGNTIKRTDDEFDTNNVNYVNVGNIGDKYNDIIQLKIYNKYKDDNNFVRRFIQERILMSVVEICVKNNIQPIFKQDLDYIQYPNSYREDGQYFIFDLSSYNIKFDQLDYIKIYKKETYYGSTTETFYSENNFSLNNVSDFLNNIINLTEVELINGENSNVCAYANVEMSSNYENKSNPLNLIDNNVNTYISTDSSSNTLEMPYIRISWEQIDIPLNSFFYIHPSIFVDKSKQKLVNIVNVLSGYYLSTMNIVDDNDNNNNDNYVTYTKPNINISDDCNKFGNDINFQLLPLISIDNQINNINPVESSGADPKKICSINDYYESFADMFPGETYEFTGSRMIYVDLVDTELEKIKITGLNDTDTTAYKDRFINTLGTDSSPGSTYNFETSTQQYLIERDSSSSEIKFTIAGSYAIDNPDENQKIYFHYDQDNKKYKIYVKDNTDNPDNYYYLGFDTSSVSAFPNEAFDFENQNSSILRWGKYDDNWESETCYSWDNILIDNDGYLIFVWLHPKMWSGWNENSLSLDYQFNLKVELVDKVINFNSRQTSQYKTELFTSITLGFLSTPITIDNTSTIKIKSEKYTGSTNIAVTTGDVYVIAFDCSDGVILDLKSSTKTTGVGMVLVYTNGTDYYQVPLSSRFADETFSDFINSGLSTLYDNEPSYKKNPYPCGQDTTDSEIYTKHNSYDDDTNYSLVYQLNNIDWFSYYQTHGYSTGSVGDGPWLLEESDFDIYPIPQVFSVYYPAGYNDNGGNHDRNCGYMAQIDENLTQIHLNDAAPGKVYWSGMIQITDQYAEGGISITSSDKDANEQYIKNKQWDFINMNDLANNFYLEPFYITKIKIIGNTDVTMNGFDEDSLKKFTKVINFKQLTKHLTTTSTKGSPILHGLNKDFDYFSSLNGSGKCGTSRFYGMQQKTNDERSLSYYYKGNPIISRYSYGRDGDTMCMGVRYWHRSYGSGAFAGTNRDNIFTHQDWSRPTDYPDDNFIELCQILSYKNGTGIPVLLLLQSIYRALYIPEDYNRLYDNHNGIFNTINFNNPDTNQLKHYLSYDLINKLLSLAFGNNRDYLLRNYYLLNQNLKDLTTVSTYEDKGDKKLKKYENDSILNEVAKNCYGDDWKNYYSNSSDPEVPLNIISIVNKNKNIDDTIKNVLHDISREINSNQN